MKKAFTVLILLFFVSIWFNGCANEKNDTGPLITPMTITNVTVGFSVGTYPPSVLVKIDGELTDNCTTFYNLTTSRITNTVNITVNVQSVKRLNCASVATPFEKQVDLGTEFVAGFHYIIFINGIKTEFDMVNAVP